MPSDFPNTITIVDTHYGGDISRIILGGVETVPGDTLLERIEYLRTKADGLRRTLLYEPHGNPQMCANLIMPPFDPEAEASYVIMEAMGYPLFSGSNTVCVATALLESGYIPMEEGQQQFRLESADGLVDITAECREDRVVSITCEGPPAFVIERGRCANLPHRGAVQYDLVWSGCLYAVVQAEDLGLELIPEERDAIDNCGNALVDAASPVIDFEHPRHGRTGPLAFVHFAGPVQRVARDRLRTRSVTYVHPDVVCRCPTGTGTAARLALMAEDGAIGENEAVETVSLTGSTFTGAVTQRLDVGPYPAVRVSMTGRAWTLARSELVIDFADPMIADDGFSVLLTPGPQAKPWQLST